MSMSGKNRKHKSLIIKETHDKNLNITRIPDLEASDYYEGTGYRMALIEDKNPRLFRFHTNSRETDALLFYIGNEVQFVGFYKQNG